MAPGIIPLAQPSAPLPFDPVQPWLAPLAGYSDLPFRCLCRHYGAAAAETEMISAKGLLFANPGTSDLLASHPEDNPLVVQLFGNEPACMADAVLRLRKRGYGLFDCNMGCPVRKVLRQKAGAALVEDVPQAVAVGLAMLGACKAEGAGLPRKRATMGFKLRLSSDGGRGTREVALRLAEAGAAWITLHPRTAAQGYGGRAQWDQVATLREALPIPVLASGDLFTAEDGIACLRQTGAAGVMYARGALGDPLIFSRHRSALVGAGGSALPTLREVIGQHIHLARLYGGQRRAFVKMRSIIPRYAKHLPGINEFRLRLCQCEHWDELAPVMDDFFSGGEGQ